MKTGASLKNRQGGAVAVMVGISMVVLIGFLAMVIDLGHLYVAKAGLQNAADAAALSGVKELDGTSNGVNSARNKAIETAGLNTFFASSGQESVVLSSPNIQFGVSQNGPWDDGSSPAGKFFIKVDTASRNLTTWFAPIWNIFTTSTFGMAVAGPIVVNITPIGVCAVDESAPENGFLRGVTYNVPSLNPLGIPADPIWINPVDPYPGPCDPNNGSTPILAPFVCTGQVSSITSVPAQVWVNTGAQPVMNAPLNSRFGLPTSYTGGHKCDPATAPADINVKEYMFDPAAFSGNCPMSSGNVRCGHPRDWMDPTGDTLPTQQGLTIIDRVPIDKTVPNAVRTPPATAQFSDYGALWSYSREKNFGTGGDHTLDDWLSLYKGQADQTATGYPTSGSGVPYTQTSGKYFMAPQGVGAAFATANRRVLNMVIINCNGEPISGATCNAHLPVLAVGQFFMQRQSDLPQNLFVEFAGLLPPGMLKPKYVLLK